MTPVESVERIEERLEDIAAGAWDEASGVPANRTGWMHPKELRRFVRAVMERFGVGVRGEPTSYNRLARLIHAKLTAREKEKAE